MILKYKIAVLSISSGKNTDLKRCVTNEQTTSKAITKPRRSERVADEIQAQRQALRKAVNDAVMRSAAFASTTPLQQGKEAPVMPPEARQAYEEVVAARKALEDFEKSQS
jgi:esterase/lipase